MSEPAAIGARVREATLGEVPAVAAAVESLLVELGGRRPSPAEMEAEVRAILGDPEVGTMLVADSAGGIVGVLGASWCRAIHVPGRYAVIQDLWVHPDWRSRGVGAELLDAIVALCSERGVGRIEVGLPRETFEAIKATEAFYLANEFEHLGPRMRRLLS
jgi:branched-chain amino acid aminotransferase